MTNIKTYSFPTEKAEVVKQFLEITKRDGGNSKVIIALMEDYVKKHGSGNPSFTLDQFIDESFMAWPALTNEEGWDKYFERNKSDKKDIQELEFYFGKYLNKSQKILRESKT